jgi:uncharacterized protein DUF4296
LKKISTSYAICFFVCIACNGEKQAEPLPPNEFLVDITLDLHMAEGMMARIGHDQRDSIGRIMREKIARKHGISPEYLEEIMSRLQRDPARNVQIYDSVLVRLRKMQERKPIKK